MVKKKSGHNVAQKMSKNSTKVFKQRENKDLGKKGGPSSSSSFQKGPKGPKGAKGSQQQPPAKRGKFEAGRKDFKAGAAGSDAPALEPREAVITEAKTFVESAFKCTDPKERMEYVAKVYGLIKGRMLEIALKHDASRIIQMLLKFGNSHYRNLVTEELERKTNTHTQNTFALITNAHTFYLFYSARD